MWLLSILFSNCCGSICSKILCCKLKVSTRDHGFDINLSSLVSSCILLCLCHSSGDYFLPFLLNKFSCFLLEVGLVSFPPPLNHVSLYPCCLCCSLHVYSSVSGYVLVLFHSRAISWVQTSDLDSILKILLDDTREIQRQFCYLSLLKWKK